MHRNERVQKRKEEVKQKKINEAKAMYQEINAANSTAKPGGGSGGGAVKKTTTIQPTKISFGALGTRSR